MSPPRDALEAAARQRGWATERIHDSGTFCRTVIRNARPGELAGHKLALVRQGRRTRLRRCPRPGPPVGKDALITRATQIDAGFDITVLAGMMATLDRFTDSEIPVPDGSPAAELRAFYAVWRSE